MVFPVVITFGVDSPNVAPGKANSYRRCAPVNNVLAPRAGTLLVAVMSVSQHRKSVAGSDGKFHEMFWPEIFHEIFREIFLKYFKNFTTDYGCRLYSSLKQSK